MRKQNDTIGLIVTTIILILALIAVEIYHNRNKESIDDIYYVENIKTGELIKPIYNDKDEIAYAFIPSGYDVREFRVVIKDKHNGTRNIAFGADGEISFDVGDDAVISVKALSSNVPSLYITLPKGTELVDLQNDKEIKVSDVQLKVTSDNSKLCKSVNGVKMKGRGNSSWKYMDKKGYQIQFLSNTSILNMDAAEKWCLVACANDETLLYNYLAYSLAKSLDMNVCVDFEYADLWINGEYRGLYLVTNRVDLELFDTKNKNSNFALFEMDSVYYDEEKYYVYNDASFSYFVLKDSRYKDEQEEKNQSLIDEFNDDVKQFCKILYSNDGYELSLNELGEYIDVESFAKYYLINEFIYNKEATVSSFYWYKESKKDVIHLGPVWDFDAGFSFWGEESTNSYTIVDYPIFRALLDNIAFNDYLNELYEEYYSCFFNLTEIAEETSEYIAESVYMNYKRWDVFGSVNLKKQMNLGYDNDLYAESYEEAYDLLTDWIEKRLCSFKICSSQEEIRVNIDDEENLVLELDSDETFSVYCWTYENGQNDMIISNNNENGRCVLPLKYLVEFGLTRIEVIKGGDKYIKLIYIDYFDVDYDKVLTVWYDDARNQFRIEFEADENISDVRFPIWKMNVEDKEVSWWYAEYDNGIYYVDIDQEWFELDSHYAVQVYGVDDEGDHRMDSIMITPHSSWVSVTHSLK